VKPLLDLLKAGGGVVTAPDAVQNKAVSFDVSRGCWVGLGRQDSFSVWDLYFTVTVLPGTLVLYFC